MVKLWWVGVLFLLFLLAPTMTVAQCSTGWCEDQESAPAYYITILGVKSLVVHDELGHTLGKGFGSIPGVTINLMGGNLIEETHSYSVVVPMDAKYVVEFTAGEHPFMVKILRGSQTTPTGLKQYSLGGSRGTTFRILLNGPQSEEIMTREDREGVTTITPDIDVSDPHGVDATPPKIRVNKTSLDDDQLLITISAEDPSGVVSIEYSLDGNTRKKYTQPFKVDVTEHPTIYAIAKDTIGNIAANQIVLAQQNMNMQTRPRQNTAKGSRKYLLWIFGIAILLFIIFLYQKRDKNKERG